MEQRNTEIAPLVGPLLALLRSRKFMAALMTLVVDVIVAYVPALEAGRGELLAVCTLIGSLLIGAIAYEDASRQGER